MRKRRPAVVLLSSSEEENEPSKPRSSRSAIAPRKRPRAGASRKASSVSHPKPRRSSRGVKAVKFDSGSEDFCEGLEDFHIAPEKTLSGLQSKEGIQLWVDKHKPQTLEELAVHKKKVEEVKKWIEDRVKAPKEDFGGNRTLLITGKTGVGKSAAIHVIASQIGAVLCEWTTPTPTLWQEHIHNSNLGLRYMSKLDEFEYFVEKSRKYSLLHMPNSEGSRKPVILLIDDLPTINGRAALVRLTKCLTALTHSTQVATIVLLTEYCKTESADSPTHHYEELESSLCRVGASKVTFNPITVNSIKRTLFKICQQEGHDVTADLINYIAKSSGGDIRHAITSLQYCCLRPEKCFSWQASAYISSKIESNDSTPVSISSKKEGEDAYDALPLSIGRDETLKLYHALGKFLHNKREITDQSALGSDTILLKDSFLRNPLKMDAPEKILSQANAQGRLITDFLHENVLDFISDEAIDDAWLVISYLCEADCLLANAVCSTYPQTDVIAQSIASSIAARGVLFGNSHPLPSRWHTIRGPKLWQIEQSMGLNKNQMQKETFERYPYNSSEVSTEYRPRIKWLSSQTPVDAVAQQNPVLYPMKADDHADSVSSDGLTEESPSEESEDEIEDC
ncbi:cell cycle checkpoint protein RAD17 isoform X1 [Dioscorea cayenensis subsp. rotundata]|uniref:Cell cycle checkpoint protein RAD17 isoform X1 n=1 Tax=Dioscorea cayennensis subsp. rotundata TaxID=55577 RepID=A0AB40CE75_DIOCR|nr:cell cycle checkpoint protein RAD17 isoform X1 [Dioscorea cayenensis subsp. rotundata]